jgi:3-hydroxymyristoyl/3-hydroxydecanoyl-(acyl carrier protein) dehydratase
MVHERVLSIGDDHPSLAGHFPGYPVVPGVVLLNEVLDTLRRGSADPLVVKGLPMVKFSSPLRPGEVVTIRVEEEGAGRAIFSCLVEARLVASGTIEFMSGATAHMERT